MADGPGVVLLVEDDEPLASIVLKHLAAHHIPTRLATSAEQAVGFISGGMRPSLIFLDINLPGDTGWSLLRSAAYAEAGSPSVVVVSATRIPGARLRDYGVKGYLPKPFSIDTLLETARRYTTGRPAGAAENPETPIDLEIR
ncbi:MAG TPA: response regulator [Candidatus Acidoferrum sp.]|jgi:DNA-binding response OmpR family regulator|nr:response regulator [Candidatus Acidoferrum sp.]